MERKKGFMHSIHTLRGIFLTLFKFVFPSRSSLMLPNLYGYKEVFHMLITLKDEWKTI